MLRIKDNTVSLSNLQPQMIIALQVAEGVFSQYEKDCIITSANDGKHSQRSLHYAGAAIDLRTRHLASQEQAKDIASAIQGALNQDFDVVLESTHIHIEYQPKRR